MEAFLHVAVRQQALYISKGTILFKEKRLRPRTAVFIAKLAKLGFAVSEELKLALNGGYFVFYDGDEMLEALKENMELDKHWPPLVTAWDRPPGDNRMKHIVTYFMDLFGGLGIKLDCGHIIPEDIFPLDRYRGCPYCGATLVDKHKFTGQGTKLKVLELWTKKDAKQLLANLLTSKTALDAMQIDSLNILLMHFPLPRVKIGVKKTVMTVIDHFVSQNEASKAQKFFKSPVDIMGYLWYKHRFSANRGAKKHREYGKKQSSYNAGI